MIKIKRPFQEGDGQPLCVALALSLRCAVGVNHHKRAITRTKKKEGESIPCRREFFVCSEKPREIENVLKEYEGKMFEKHL